MLATHTPLTDGPMRLLSHPESKLCTDTMSDRWRDLLLAWLQGMWLKCLWSKQLSFSPPIFSLASVTFSGYWNSGPLREMVAWWLCSSHSADQTKGPGMKLIIIPYPFGRGRANCKMQVNGVSKHFFSPFCMEWKHFCSCKVNCKAMKIKPCFLLNCLWQFESENGGIKSPIA